MMAVVSLGKRSMMATVTWELLREGGSILSEWRESYRLVRMGDDWRIFASVNHAA